MFRRFLLYPIESNAIDLLCRTKSATISSIMLNLRTPRLFELSLQIQTSRMLDAQKREKVGRTFCITCYKMLKPYV